ncbi:MAG: short-chain dehydrogenase, partial [Chitinophagaceae bacterium]
LNMDVGGKGRHDAAPPVSDFIEAVFQQLKEGKNEIIFGCSAPMAEANTKKIQVYFYRMNPG